MRRYNEAVKADVRTRMSPPQRQSVALISEELGIQVVALYNWSKAWRLQGEVVPASQKEPEGWSAADTVQGKRAGSPYEPIHGATSDAMQDMIKGVVCPLGTDQCKKQGKITPKSAVIN